MPKSIYTWAAISQNGRGFTACHSTILASGIGKMELSHGSAEFATLEEAESYLVDHAVAGDPQPVREEGGIRLVNPGRGTRAQSKSGFRKAMAR